MQRGILLLLATVIGSLPAVSGSSGDSTASSFATVVRELREHFCPDRRVAVFDVEASTLGDTLILRGETDLAAARDSLMAAARKTFGSSILDSVTMLPHPTLGDSTFGIVVLSVANVRSKPGHSEELATQVTMGLAVKLLKRGRGYFYVQSHDAYIGWLDSDAFERTTREGVDAWAKSKKVVVTEYFDIVRVDPSRTSLPVSDVVIGNILRAGAVEGQWQRVELADGRSGYLPASSVANFDDWNASRNLSGENIERVATMFLGVPYLWGGTSSKGMDCSGFTKTVFRMNGLELSRDASQQVLMGRDVEPGKEFENLRKGDLLFFGRPATDDRPERIVHVGIYLQNMSFIHSSGRVRFASFDPASENYDDYNRTRFVRARRLVPERTVPEK